MNINTQVLKNRFKSTLKSMNPISNYYAKAEKIELKQEIINELNRALREARKNKIISANDFTKIVFHIERVDVRNNVSILAQSLIKSKSLESIQVIALIKLMSLYVSYDSKNYSQVKKILNVNLAIAKLIKFYSKKYVKSFANDIDKLTNSEFNQKSVIQQELRIDVDLIRRNYWNKAIVAAQIIEKNTSHFIEFPQTIFINLVKFQILFHEQNLFLKNKSNFSLQKYITYDAISLQASEKYNIVKEQLSKYSNINVDSFTSHINETSKFIRLSDLPPMNGYQLVGLLVSYLLLLLWSVIILLPLAQMVILSFDGSGGLYIGTQNVSGNRGWFIHYQELINDTNFRYWLGNSLIVSVSTMVLTVSFTVLLAYAFSRFRFPGRRSSILTVMLLQMVPSIAALTAFLVLYQLTNLDMLVFLIIIYTGGALTGNTFILKGYLDSIPIDLDEAAKIDGASTARVFLTILVPLSKPMIAIVALWSFIGPFGDVILPVLLAPATVEGNKQLTMAAGLRTLIAGTNPHQYTFLAGAIITGVPLTILFVVAQKFLVSGLTKGAVK
ncbi:arabinogalactan oligomer/maltooligosaccharide transport system permease protein [Mycoplasma testudineum]|uniref:Arabinogalactan oligomer/maltooligosaccharide transport system permease protein n=1 Tax=Mycoplasma testudineum TaxID=244584 RepID=A0A4R6IJL1_9MOLU|nr:sugar ABC transporter permease [Mycoplasma testudineum]OYD26437.1 hypothetical protein CG473_03970 [Mycoplasma testudineum]TDO22126.1 arabinogalactan oligomer/maltooligosaccharide transport system permease protein [Mycoplasma testudineum]